MRRAMAVLSLVVVAHCTPASAQGPSSDPVVSVKRTAPGQLGGTFTVEPGGRLVVRNLTVNALIGLAYSTDLSQLLPDQLTGGPTWIHTERFDIEGKIPNVRTGDPVASGTAARDLIRTVLRDRFKLQTHTETRELPIYVLVLARSSGTLGPFLKAAANDCAQRNISDAACGTRVTDDEIHARGLPFGNFVVMLQNALGRQTVDNDTGLSGDFDIDLRWTPEPVAANPATDASGGPSIFTAVQEQLGLKLDVRRVPKDVLVIDHIERPSQD